MPIVTTSTQAAELVGRSKVRQSLVFKNEDAALAVYIKKERNGALNVSSTVHDFKLDAGESFALVAMQDGDEAIQDRWTVIAASGTPIVSVYETEIFER